jgi:hypothetical protein
MTAPPDRHTSALADHRSIEHRLDEGGQGTAYRAHDLEFDSPIALKVLKPELRAKPRKVDADDLPVEYRGVHSQGRAIAVDMKCPKDEGFL